MDPRLYDNFVPKDRRWNLGSKRNLCPEGIWYNAQTRCVSSGNGLSAENISFSEMRCQQLQQYLLQVVRKVHPKRVLRGSKTDPDRVSSLVVLVSIIQTRPLLAFNGPSANVLSGQREPRVLRHFNGCNDERMKLERGDRVSLTGEGPGGETGEGSGGEETDGLTGQV